MIHSLSASVESAQSSKETEVAHFVASLTDSLAPSKVLSVLRESLTFDNVPLSVGS